MDSLESLIQILVKQKRLIHHHLKDTMESSRHSMTIATVSSSMCNKISHLALIQTKTFLMQLVLSRQLTRKQTFRSSLSNSSKIHGSTETTHSQLHQRREDCNHLVKIQLQVRDCTTQLSVSKRVTLSSSISIQRKANIHAISRTLS